MNELKSYTEYAVSTPTADFVIGFDFNYGEDAVNVTVDDVPATEAGYTVVYLNETTIRLSPSVPSGVVRLQRETDIDQTDHAYRAGAKFIAQTMDENFEQLRHSQQEVRDGFNKLADDTYEIIDTLQEVGQSAQDAADAAEVAARLANDAAAQVNDKVSYADFNNKPHNDMLGRDVAAAHPTGAILDASGETQQQVNYNGGSKWHSRVGGYKLNERVILTSGGIVKSTIDGNTNDPNSDMTGWVKTNLAGQIFDASGLSQQAINDNFKTLVNFYVTPENYGIRDGDWTEAIQWCVDTGKEVVLSGAVYNISKPIYLSNLQHKIRGLGGKVSVINKIGDTKLGLPDVVRDGKTFNIDKDAVFICYNAGHQQLNFEHFRVQKNYREDEQYTGYGLFAPFVSEFVNIDFFSWFVYYGFYTINCWMSTWIRCHANAKAGFVLGGLAADSDFLRGGTSLSLISCWSTNTGENESTYAINGFAYSNAISCGSDNIGRENAPAFATWKFTECPSFNLLSCGGEVINAKHLFYASEGSQVDVKSHYITHFYNKYSNVDAPYLIYAIGSSKITVSNSTIPFVYDVLAGYPNFAAADYASYVSIEECKHYPPITGNNFGNFGVYSIRGSHIKFSNGGYSFEESGITTNANVANFAIGDNTNIASNSSASSGTFGLVGNAGRWNTSLQRISDARLWWDATVGVIRTKNFSDPTSEKDGYILGGCEKGPSSQRPVTFTLGILYLDTTLAANGKPIWSSDVNTWVDAQGNIV